VSTGTSLQAVETHISSLFFTPDRVYKLLKPVRTGFLDHSDRTARIEATRIEYERNRRLAPDVYLGLGDLHEHDELVDQIIIMRRLPADRSLTRLLATDERDSALRSVARAVAGFHARLEPVFDPVPLATPDGLAAFWQGNLDELAPVVGDLVASEQFEQVRTLAFDYLAHHAALLGQRRADGWVRDGHGDLIADDIFVLDDGPRILDCLAFDPDYRVGDVLADIAFLVMDVERIADRHASHRLMRWYHEFSGEHHPGSLAHHYVAYRAHVRAKIAAIRYRQGDIAAAALVHSHHAQALEHLLRARGTLVLVGGSPGTGKTTLANELGASLNWMVLDSDTVRKDLHGVNHHDHDVAAHPELYSEAATDATYTELARRAGRLLDAGESVVLDATWTHRRHRRLAHEVAASQGARLIEFECQLDAPTARQRITARMTAQHTVSDATAADVDRLRVRDAWPGVVIVSTDADIDVVVGAAVGVVLAAPTG
jgi:aminoglycoside phosphotransferase family enzyme/predicted kinase